MPEYVRRVRAFSPDLWRVLLAAAIVFVVWLGILAVLYNLYLLRLGFDTRTVGLLAGLGALVWGVAALPAAVFGNRFGLRNSIMMGIAVFGAGIALTLMVERMPQAQWQVWLLGSQVVTNIGIALATVNAPPYMMAVSGDYERPHAFAFLAALNPLAAFVGSVLAGVLPGVLAATALAGSPGANLDRPEPYRMALWVGPLLCLVAILPLVGAAPGRTAAGPGEFATNERPAGTFETQAAKTSLPVGLLAFWAIVMFLEAMSEGSVRTFFNVLLDRGLGTSTAEIGFVMGAAQLLPIAVALAVPMLLARWGTGYTLLGGILALAACLVPFAFGAQSSTQAQTFVYTVLLIGIPYLAASATFSVIRASRNLFSQEMVIPRWRANSQGATTLGVALGLAAIGIAGGMLIEAFGFGALFIAGAVAGLAAALLLFLYLYMINRRRAAQSMAGRSA